jgi:hypothetical protein
MFSDAEPFVIGVEVVGGSMGVVVVVPGQAEPWMVSNRAFAMLVDVATELVEDPADEDVLAGAAANHGLFLDSLDQPQRYRVAAALASAAAQLRSRLLGQRQVDGWSLSLASSLPVLGMWLEGLVEEAEEATAHPRTSP